MVITEVENHSSPTYIHRLALLINYENFEQGTNSSSNILHTELSNEWHISGEMGWESGKLNGGSS